MTSLKRLSQALAIVTIGAAAITFGLEATEVSSTSWRRSLARKLEDAAIPDWPLWISGLFGFALALIGIALVAAQIAPPKRGLNSMHEVYRGSDGDTRIRGRAAIRAAQYELEKIDGVTAVAGRMSNKAIHLEVQVDDRSDLVEVEDEARNRLDHGFWISLGLADLAVNLLMTHHPAPPRVR